jgi:hypothetical protein
MTDIEDFRLDLETLVCGSSRGVFDFGLGSFGKATEPLCFDELKIYPSFKYVMELKCSLVGN